MVGNDLKDLYVYSYNDNTGVIKETGKVSINADNYLSIQISLEKMPILYLFQQIQI